MGARILILSFRKQRRIVNSRLRLACFKTVSKTPLKATTVTNETPSEHRKKPRQVHQRLTVHEWPLIWSTPFWFAILTKTRTHKTYFIFDWQILIVYTYRAQSDVLIHIQTLWNDQIRKAEYPSFLICVIGLRLSHLKSFLLAIYKSIANQAQWLTPIISTLWTLRQGNCCEL